MHKSALNIAYAYANVKKLTGCQEIHCKLIKLNIEQPQVNYERKHDGNYLLWKGDPRVIIERRLSGNIDIECLSVFPNLVSVIPPPADPIPTPVAQVVPEPIKRAEPEPVR